MSARGMVVARLFVLGCALVLTAFGAQRAQADPNPEAPPQPHNGSAHVQPAPAPSASGTTSSTSTQVSSSTSTRVGSSTSTTPPVSTSVRTARHRTSSRPLHARPRRHTTPAQAAQHKPPSLNSGWPAWLRDAAGLNELRSVGGSGSSSLPVAAGIALVLLVLAEASFLGLARSRLGRADVRADEPVAIRRVQLRR